MPYQTYLHFTLLLTLTTCANGAPIDHRDPKSLTYYDYLSPADYALESPQNDFYLTDADDENTLGRNLPPRIKQTPPNAANRPYNSPIYYIRLPPTPYMFVPGLGYISQPAPPPQHPISPLLNLPVSFVTNGKPSTIYQWSGMNNGGFAQAPTKKPAKIESPVHQLGQYEFNGKPEDIFVLRDSYNSLYGDALQNFYP